MFSGKALDFAKTAPHYMAKKRFLTGRLPDWLAGYLAGYLADYLADWLADYMTDYLAD